jgi:GT2 family glycosyltransferase
LPICAVIPTYRREQVLLDTIEFLLELQPAPAEILVVDQTEEHEPATALRLETLNQEGRIRWLKLAQPSIPKAMNTGLLAAREPLVLFLDDDIRPEPGLLDAHASAHASFENAIVAGRVIQPWEEGASHDLAGEFRFCQTQPAWIGEFMGGNFSAGRDRLIELGGFDENFVRVAYRFEAEFAHRFKAAGGGIRFEPGACIHHLKAGGGTRVYGDFRTTWRPDHTVGAYYYLLRTSLGLRGLGQWLARPVAAVATRHHVTRPWWIPMTVLSELLGMMWACWLALAGPRYVTRSART